MRIVVTGGAGFIGSHVVDTYLRCGHEILVVDDLSTGWRGNVSPRAEFVRTDIRDRKALAEAFARFRPELVNHHAAQADIRRSLADPVGDADVNVVGTLILLEEAVRAEVRGVLFASSAGMIYGEMPTPAAETWPKRPTTPYGTAKVAVEHYLFAYARTRGLEVASLRYGNVYGPRQATKAQSGVVVLFAEAMLASRAPTVYGDGEQRRDFVAWSDVAQANLLATDFLLSSPPAPEAPDDRAFNVATGRSTSINELFSLLGGRTDFCATPLRAAARVGDFAVHRFDVGKAREVLGFSAKVALEEGLDEVIAWLRRER